MQMKGRTEMTAKPHSISAIGSKLCRRVQGSLYAPPISDFTIVSRVRSKAPFRNQQNFL